MIEAVCHCGAARLTAPRPVEVTECNCSICRRLAARWAHYSPREVGLPDGRRTEAYVWGDRMLAFHRCRTCGCVTHWQSLDGSRDRMAINARLMDLDWSAVRIRPFDGASSWRYLDEPADEGDGPEPASGLRSDARAGDAGSRAKVSLNKGIRSQGVAKRS